MRAKLFSSILATGLSAYGAGWDHMAGTVQAEAEQWIAAQSAHGLQIEYDQLRVEGYPYKPVLHLQGAEVTFAKLSEKSSPVVARLADVKLRLEGWSLKQAQISAPVVMLDYTAGPAGPMVAQLRDVTSWVTLTGTAGDLKKMQVQVGDMYWQQVALPVDKRSHAKGLDLTVNFNNKPVALAMAKDNDVATLQMTARQMHLQDLPDSPFGKVIEEVQLESRLKGAFVPGMNAVSLSRWRDQGGHLDVQSLRVQSKDVSLRLHGDLTVDKAFKPKGMLFAQVDDYDKLVDHLAKTGLGRDEYGLILMDGLERMAVVDEGSQGGKRILPFSLNLFSGYVFAGPLLVAELPPLVRNIQVAADK